MPRNALGRGLGALIREPEPQAPVRPAEDASVTTVGVPASGGLGGGSCAGDGSGDLPGHYRLILN